MLLSIHAIVNKSSYDEYIHIIALFFQIPFGLESHEDPKRLSKMDLPAADGKLWYFALLWPFVGIHQSTMDSPHKSRIMWSFVYSAVVFFVISLSKLLKKGSVCGCFETPWGSCDVTVM